MRRGSGVWSNTNGGRRRGGRRPIREQELRARGAAHGVVLLLHCGGEVERAYACTRVRSYARVESYVRTHAAGAVVVAIDVGVGVGAGVVARGTY